MSVEQPDDDMLLGLVERGLAALSARPLSGAIDDTELTDRVERLHRVETSAAAEKLRCIAEIDVRQAWRGEGARSTADLLAQRLRLTRGEARAQADVAVVLESLPQTAQALRDGAIGLGQAQVAARAAKDVRPDVREELDRLVAGDGGGMDRRQLRERVDEWTHTVDPDALAGRERRAWNNRRLSVSAEGPDGVVRGQFELDPVGGATLIAGLDALSRRTDKDDDRSFPQRQADALVWLAQRALDAGDLPQVAVQRPHVILITTAETLDGEPGAPPAQLDDVGPVSTATAQMLCCDAETTPVYMTRNHEVLDAGRTRKQPTRAQRMAVIARDKRCVGCGAPAARCQVHHVRWWIRDLGPTDEENLCLTCWTAISRFITTTGSSSAGMMDVTPSCRRTRWPRGEEPDDTATTGK
jgi:NAD-dependent dihydropyrimidine dehydrogenase PreA subunit